MTLRRRLPAAALGGAALMTAAAGIGVVATATPATHHKHAVAAPSRVKLRAERGAARTAPREPRATLHAKSAHRSRRALPAPPDTQTCRNLFGADCYSPGQFATAYNVQPLWQQKVTGAGKTIVIVDPFGSPTLRHDIAVFDRVFNLPPTKLIVNRPEGPIPAYRPTESRVGWAVETTLDVDFAHAMAPGATIRLIRTPRDETEGRAGLPKIMRAERWVATKHLGDVISQSFGATEQTFPSRRSIKQLRYSFEAARKAAITVVAASGDLGATDDTKNMSDVYHHRVQSWPSADPLVTSIGGLRLHLNGNGNRTAPDRVWDDADGAGGGGQSAVFARPWWQRRVSGDVGRHRGVPDLSMSAAVNGGGLIWTTFRGQQHGWSLVGGTSLATPLFAGIMALADQAAGHDLGDINPTLYAMAGRGAAARAADGIIDVTRGNNSYDGVHGWAAKPGYDLASGWGTIDAAKFVPALISAAAR